MPLQKRPICYCAVLALLLVWGCGPKVTAPQARLAGTITIDGKPLQHGSISFIPTGSGQAPPARASIRSGKYEVAEAPQGRVLLRFSATEETGETDEEGQAILRNLIPENCRDGIEIQITGDDLQKNIELKSEPTQKSTTEKKSESTE